MTDLKIFLTNLAGLQDDEALLDFCRKYNLHGTPKIFEGAEDKYYDFRKFILYPHHLFQSLGLLIQIFYFPIKINLFRWAIVIKHYLITDIFRTTKLNNITINF